MSQIEDLISHHCPNGVEFIELQKLFTTRNGYTPSRRKPEYWENGTIPWFRLADIRGSDRILTEAVENVSPSAVKKSGLFPAGTIIISTLATIGEHALMEVPGLCNQQLTALTLRESYAGLVNIKFLFYYAFVLADWCKKNTMNSSFASVDMKQFKRFKFPVPPLEAQDEIVRILDSFTKLEAELEAELEARRKQYEYYRDSLLKCAELRGSWACIGDISLQSVSGGTPLKSKSEYYGGEIPWLRTQEVHFNEIYETENFITKLGFENSSAKWVNPNSVVVAISGATAGRSAIIKKSLTTNQHCAVFEIDSAICNYRYVYYWLANNYLELKSLGRGARGDLNLQIIRNFRIPVPPLAEQERIVAILDKFDALVNDLTSGLPEEIAARRKQYEYYRDRLLTFTPAK